MSVAIEWTVRNAQNSNQITSPINRIGTAPSSPKTCSAIKKAVINVTQIAQEFRVSRYSLQSHRERHLPACMPMFQTWHETGRLTGRRRHVCELTVNALGALAQAEYGALTACTNDGQASSAMSTTTIARKIRDARTGLDQLACLAADAVADEERPQDLWDAEFTERLNEAWARIDRQAPPAQDSP